MTVYVASDHAGFALKETVLMWLRERGLDVVDLGPESRERVDYPDFAHSLAERVSSAESGGDLGVLVCGSGVGMSIAANRHAGVRAVVCSEAYSARLARQHNDANVLCIGERVVGEGTARDIVDAFFDATFEGGRHAARVGKIDL